MNQPIKLKLFVLFCLISNQNMNENIFCVILFLLTLGLIQTYAQLFILITSSILECPQRDLIKW